MAASSSSVPCACMSGISSRATNGKVTKMVASTMPGTAKMICTSWRGEPRAEPSLRAKEQDVDQPRHHRRDREGQIDQRDQQALAAEVELGDGPRGRHAEHEIERHRDGGGEKREVDGGKGVGLDERDEVGADALLERVEKDGHERESEEKTEKGERDCDEQPPSERRLDAARPARSRAWRSLPWSQASCRRPLHHWSRLMLRSRTNEKASITTAIRRGAGVVVLLELGDDQERRDFGLHRHVAGDEDDGAVLPDGARRRPARSR